MKLIISILILIHFTVAKDLTPTFSLKSKGSVTEILYQNSLLYASNDKGGVDIFDTTTKELKEEIKLPLIKDFTGDEVPAKIYSIDLLNNQVLIVSQGKSGFRNLFIYKDNTLTQIIDSKDRYFIKKAKFVDNDKIILGLLSNEIIFFDIKNKKELYKEQINKSSFSDFALSEDKNSIVTSDESGVVTLLDTKSGKIKKVFKGQNVDNIYQVDYKNSFILGAGQDRRVSIYKENSSLAYYLEGTFLIYSVGLTPSGKLAGYAANENNEVVIFDTLTKETKFTLKGQKTTLTKILFINEDEVFTSSEDNTINYWRLK